MRAGQHTHDSARQIDGGGTRKAPAHAKGLARLADQNVVAAIERKTSEPEETVARRVIVEGGASALSLTTKPVPSDAKVPSGHTAAMNTVASAILPACGWWISLKKQVARPSLACPEGGVPRLD